MRDLIPENLRPKGRKTYQAYDGINNTFNLAYAILRWKVYMALIKAKLEPFLGFIHSVQYGKPSLVLDFQELYRYLLDDFLIQFCQNLNESDFTMKTERKTRKKYGKREYLTDMKTKQLVRSLYDYLENKVKIPRMKVGRKQTIETLINEEALLLAKFLRDERKTWIPRTAVL